MKNSQAWQRWFNVNISVIIRSYTLFPIFNIIKEYITSNHMLTSSYIFLGLIPSTFGSYLYGLIRSILYLIFVRPYCQFTAPIGKHHVITNGPLDGVSYLYAAWLLSMTLYPTLWSWPNWFLFSWILSLLICVYFSWLINYQYTLCFIGRIISQSNNNCPGL